MKKVLSMILAVLLIFGSLPVLSVFSSAEDTVETRVYTNVARNKPVRTGNDSGFNTGSYVTDGSYNNYVDISWGSIASPNANCYVIVDLEQTFTVNGVKVANYADNGRYYRWDAYASVDMVTWTLIAQKASSAPSVSGGYYLETDEISARYIKVVGTYHSANSGYHFAEVEVYSPDVYTAGSTVSSVYQGDGYVGTLTADGTLTVAASNGTPSGEEPAIVEPAPVFEGSGTAEDPYLIKTAADFKTLTDLFNETTAEADAYGAGLFFKQTADIDMTQEADYTGTRANGNATAYFGGVYDGAGHTLTVNIDWDDTGSTNGQTSVFPYITGAILNLKCVCTIDSAYSAQPIRTTRPGAVVANCVFDVNLNSDRGNGVVYSSYGVLFNVYVTGVGKKAVYNTNSNGSYYHVFTNMKDSEETALTHSTTTASSDPVEIAAAFNDTTDSAYTSGVAALHANNAALDADALGAVTVVNGELALSAGTISGGGTGEPEITFEESGTAADPILISTPEDFKYLTALFNASTSSSSAYGTGLFFRQTADIDMKDVEGYEGTHADGNGKRYFGGVYDGGGYTLNVNITSSGQTSIFPYITGAILNLKVTGKIESDTSAQPIRTVQAGAVVANCVFEMTLTSSIGNGVSYSIYGTLYNVYVSGVGTKAVYNSNSNGSYYNVFTNMENASGGALTHSTTTASNDLDAIAAAFADREGETALSGAAALTANNAALSADSLESVSVSGGALVFSHNSSNPGGNGGEGGNGEEPVASYGIVGGADSTAADYPWNASSAYIRKVIVDSSVTSLGSNAFAGCSNLHTVRIMGKVTLGNNVFPAGMTKLTTFGEYYTDLYVRVLGTSNESTVRRALENAYGGVKWTTFEDDSILYVYGCGPLAYPNRDSIPWFLAASIRGKYEKVIVADAITDIGQYAFSADAYGKLEEIVLGASMQQFKYQSMAYIPLASLTFLAPITYFGHYTTTANKYGGTLEVTLASGQSSEDLLSKQDGYPGSGTAGNEKLQQANFTSVPLRHVEWIDDTTGKAVFATYIADGQTPVFPVENTFVHEGVTYEFDLPTVEAVTEDKTYHLASRALIDYEITWVNGITGAVLYSESFAYGTTPVYGGVTRYEDAGTVYVATVPAVEPVTGPATYTVPFTPLPKYAIRWINAKTGEVLCEAQVSETVLPEFTGTLPDPYVEGDVTYTPLLPVVHEVTGAEDYMVYFYADYDAANYPTVYPSGIHYKLLDEETLYIYGSGAIPSYESSGGDNAPWAQYRQTVKKIIVSDGITEIGSCALRDFPVLEEIVLGKDVHLFNYAAFAIDYNLERMTFLGTITYYGHQCFSGMSKTLVVTQASGQTHQDLKNAQAYGGSASHGNDQLFKVTSENYRMVPRVVARFVDGKTGDTLFITSLASGAVPYFPVDLPAPYVEEGIIYTPVLPELDAITESTTYTVEYAPDHAHDYGEWTTAPATFTAAGTRTHVCTVCGHEETEEIPAAILDVCNEVIVGVNEKGKNTAAVVGTITCDELDMESVDYLEVTLTFYQGGEVVKTVDPSVKVKNVYKTIKDVATTNESVSSSQGLQLIDATYLFSLKVNGIPAGAYTVEATVSAVLNGESPVTVARTIDFEIGANG